MDPHILPIHYQGRTHTRMLGISAALKEITYDMCGQGERYRRTSPKEDLILLWLVAAQSELRESESQGSSDERDALVTKTEPI
jgi:hypothetical protein